MLAFTLCTVTALTLAIVFSQKSCNGNGGTTSGGGSGGSSDAAYTYYTVTYDFGGAMENKTERVKAGTFLSPAEPVSDFYDFIGWFKDSKYKQWFDFDEPVYSDVTLYARLDEKSIDREIFLKRFNEEQESIPAEKLEVSKVWLSGINYTVEVEGGVSVEKHEKAVTDGFTSFDVPFTAENGKQDYINYMVQILYSESALKKEYYENKEYEILSESYVFHKNGGCGFTIKYRQKEDDNVYTLLTNLDEYHRLNAAVFSMVLGADEHGHGTDVNLYLVFVNYED